MPDSGEPSSRANDAPSLSLSQRLPDVADSASLEIAPAVSNSLGLFNATIVPGPALAGNPAALAAFNRAARQWERYIADPIVVTIEADLAPLGPSLLGTASSVVLAGSYATVRNAIVADAADEADDGVATLLPTAAGFSAFLPAGFQFSGDVRLTKANAKALGFTDLDAVFGAADGNITFSSTFPFDYDNSDGITLGQFDFETVAVHEIGHALGFISEVDFIDFVLNVEATSNAVEPTPLDLFRFDDGSSFDPGSLASFTTLPRSLVPGNREVFDQISSLYGGDAEVLLATGTSQGDGRQASHWKDNLGLGVMDPTLAPGEISPIRRNDLRALDLIGYEITIPEPGSCLLLVTGIIVVGNRRRIV